MPWDGARPHRRARPPDVGLRAAPGAAGRRRAGAPRRGRPPPAGRVPVGSRADPPVARALPGRGDLRGARRRSRVGGIRITSRRSSATCCSRSCSTPRSQGEEGWFTLADVARGIHDKLVSRHPHVFGDVEVADAAEVASNWERLKAEEKGRSSVLDGVPDALPALMLAAKVLRKADSVGIEPSPGGSRLSTTDCSSSWPRRTPRASIRSRVRFADRVGAVMPRDPRRRGSRLVVARPSRSDSARPAVALVHRTFRRH